MPELPEVETIRCDLSAQILGIRIRAVQVLAVKSIGGGSKKFIATLVGSKFQQIDRIGKLLIFKINPKSYLLIHLKMTGQLIYRDQRQIILGGHSEPGKGEKRRIIGDLPNKSTRVIISLANNAKLYFNDQRRFGYLRLVDSLALEKIKAGFGPEPGQSAFNENFLVNLLASRSRNIKALLLDQKQVAGLGNIYADEALFLAGIRPDRPAGSLSLAEIKRLVKSAKELIKLAIKHRGTTFSDYRDASGRQGGFLTRLQVYGRRGQKCYRCGGIITKIKLAGRGTHFCPRCQK